MQQMRHVQPITKAKQTLKFSSCPSGATTEGLNLLCHALAQQVAKRSITQVRCHPQRDRKGKKQNLAAGGAKPSAPFPLLPASTMCPLRVLLGRDLVTFECPIKRRRPVRAPAWAPFRHVADEQASAVPVNAAPSSHPLVLFSCLLPPSVLPRCCTNTFPSTVKDPLPAC